MGSAAGSSALALARVKGCGAPCQGHRGEAPIQKARFRRVQVAAAPCGVIGAKPLSKRHASAGFKGRQPLVEGHRGIALVWYRGIALVWYRGIAPE